MTYTGKVTKVNRLKNSYFGNPRYSIWLEDHGRFITPSDAGWVYGLDWKNMVGVTAYITVGPRNNSRTVFYFG